MYIKRTAEKMILEVSKSFPCIVVYGPRQVGKSTRLCHHKGEKTQGGQGKKDNYAKIIRTCSQKTNTEAFKERRAPRVNSDKGKWRFTAEQIVKRSSF